VRVEYKSGNRERQVEDRNADGAEDLRSFFDTDGENVTHIEDDKDFDGRFETTRYFKDGALVRSEADTDGDGEIELTVYYKNGAATRVDTRSDGSDCVDIRQWINKKSEVTAEEKDSDGNCKYDTWNYFTDGRLRGQGRDTEGRGYGHLYYVFDKQGNVQVQEIAGAKSNKPEKKAFYSSGGDVVRQCTDNDRDGDFESEMSFEFGVARMATSDSDNSGTPDRREFYEAGALVRVEADTNGDGRPDVAQDYAGGQVSRQDEDTDFDGEIDVRFEEGKPIPLKDTLPAPSKIPNFDCGQFNAFWG
jgi:antitoxin component YwqK of YwqJK toxin-antitoxin module